MFGEISESDLFLSNVTLQENFEDLKRKLKEMFRLTNDLPSVSFDSNFQLKNAVAVDNHTMMLWNFMLLKEHFGLKSSEDILTDLATCQNQHSDDIKDLKERAKDSMCKFKLLFFKARVTLQGVRLICDLFKKAIAPKLSLSDP